MLKNRPVLSRSTFSAREFVVKNMKNEETKLIREDRFQ